MTSYKKGIQIFFFAIITIDAVTSNLPNDPDLTSTVVEGISILNISPPIFYTSFVPLIYEFKLPRWSEADIAVKWPYGDSNSCTRSEKVTNMNNIGCGVVHLYNSILEEFLAKTKILQEPIDSFTQYSNARCIHNPTSSTTASGIMKQGTYWEILAGNIDCPPNKIDHRNTIAVEFSSFQTTKWNSLLKKFRDSYVSKLSHFSISSATYANSYSAMQAGVLVDLLQSVGKWERSLDLCQAGVLPRHLVSKKRFTSSLEKIKSQLAHQNMQPSINIGENQLYYKLPLTDCVFEDERTMILRILIPIKPIGRIFKVVEVMSIPFLSSGLDRAPAICSLKDVDGTFIYEEKTGMVRKSGCNPNSLLCPILHPDTFLEKQDCVTSLLRNDTENLQICKSECFPFDVSSGYIIKRVKSDQFLILGDAMGGGGQPNFIIVSCAGNLSHELQPKSIGALEVILSCDCKMVYNNVQYLPEIPHCGKKFSTRHIVPLIASPNLPQPDQQTSTTTTTTTTTTTEMAPITLQSQDNFSSYGLEIMELQIKLAQIEDENEKLKQLTTINDNRNNMGLIFTIISCVMSFCALTLSINNCICGVKKKGNEAMKEMQMRPLHNQEVLQTDEFRNCQPSAPPASDLYIMENLKEITLPVENTME